MRRNSIANITRTSVTAFLSLVTLGFSGCIVFENATGYSFEEAEPESARIDRIFDSLGTLACYSVATNSARKVTADLALGAEASNDAMLSFARLSDWIEVDFLFFPIGLWQVGSVYELEPSVHLKEVYAQRVRLSLLAHKIVRHSEQWNLGDPCDVLKNEFSTSDMKVIGVKLRKERAEYDDIVEDLSPCSVSADLTKLKSKADSFTK
jgi:hypothetical protein